MQTVSIIHHADI